LRTIIYSACEANNSLLNRFLNQNSMAANDALRLSLPNNTSTPNHPMVQSMLPVQMPVDSSSPQFEMASVNDVQFTVGSFAMTRFGTTKVKNAPTAINRLRLKQRSRQVVENGFRPIQSATNTPLPFSSTDTPRSFSAMPFCPAPGAQRQSVSRKDSMGQSPGSFTTFFDTPGSNVGDNFSCSGNASNPFATNSISTNDGSSPNSTSSNRDANNSVFSDRTSSPPSVMTPFSHHHQAKISNGDIATSLFGLPPIRSDMTNIWSTGSF